METKISIRLKHGSPLEAETRDALIALLERYDLTRWLFTRTVVIDEMSIPHSHPVLTLHTRHATQEDRLLSTFVHEQLHWHLSSTHGATQRAIAEIRTLWPDPPAGLPDGAQDAASSYLHVVVNYLEWQAVIALIGDQRANAVMEFWCTDHYRAIYRFVMDERDRVAAIVGKYELEPG